MKSLNLPFSVARPGLDRIEWSGVRLRFTHQARRESRGIETVRRGAGADKVIVWDGRFAVALAGSRWTAEIGPLGATGWAALVAGTPALRDTALPSAARLSLPALRDESGLVAVPALGYRRPGRPRKTLIAAFQPLRPMAAAVFAAPALP